MNPRSHKPRCVVVDDDPLVLQAVGSLLERQGYGVSKAATVEQADAQLNVGTDVCVLDWQLGPHTGMDVLRRIRRRALPCGGCCARDTRSALVRRS